MEGLCTMGKLVDKLREVTTASGGGLGFFGRGHAPGRAVRPAALLAAGGRDDLAALRAAAESGADGVIVAGWTASGAGVADLAAALRAGAGIWGVRLGRDYAPGALAAARDQGAAFAVLDQGLPASALFEEAEQLDLVVAIEPPREDLALLALRAVNLLPVQAALLETGLSSAGLERLTIADFNRLQLVNESLRFPALCSIQGAPAAGHVRALVELGAAAIVLGAAGVAAGEIGQQVRAALAALEKTPAPRGREGTALLSGMLGIAGHQPAVPGPGPRPRPDEPEREPDEE
jgi:hypothetical protein